MGKHHQICHPRLLPRPYYHQDVPYQRFTHSGSLSSRFAVVFETTVERRKHERAQNALCRTLEKALADRMDKEEGTLTRPINLPRDQIPPFVKNTGWASLFDGYDFNVLSDLVDPPATASDDAPLSIESVIWAAMAHVGLTASQNCRDASSTLRFEMQRSSVEATFEPFRCPNLKSSIIAYARTWLKVVLFFFRTRPGETHDCPGYELTDAQGLAFARFRTLVSAAAQEPGWRTAVSLDGLADVDDADHEAEAREEEEAALARTKTGRGVVQEPFLELDGVHEACLDFCLSLLCQRTHLNDFEQPLIVALSCLGVSRRGWVPAGVYTQHLSAVVSLGNMMFLQGAIHAANARGSRPPPVREELQKLKDRWGIRGSAAPMEWALNKRAYGFSIHNSVGGSSRFLLENGRIHFRDNHIHHLEFAALVQSHLRTTRTTLGALLVVESVDQLPLPPLDLMIDNPHDDEPGASVVQVWERADKSKALSDAKHWLCDRITSDSKLCARHLDPQTGEANENALRRFLQSEQCFLDQLLVLIHLSYGAPARGPELLGVRYTKTALAERNVIVSHGHVCLLIEYNKRGWTPIYRFLPRPVGHLVLWYLTFVRPFSEGIRAHLDPDGASSPYLWHATSDGRAFTTTRLSKGLGRLFQRANVKDVGVKDYRQMATIWMREHCVESMVTFANEQGAAGDGTDESVDWATTVVDQQFGHSSRTATMHYGRLDTSSFFRRPGTPSLRGYMLGSVAWFKFCGFLQDGGAVEVEGGGEDDRLGKASRDRQLALRDGLASVDLLAALRRMYAVPDAEFRGKQLEALRCIVAGHRCVVAVLPTGAGKSLLYQLPAFTGLAGLTIVVSPYLALLNDQAAKCLPYRISHFVWDGKQDPPRHPHLLFVTPESFVLPPFQSFMNEAIARYRLHRVVIDEFHECRSAFREAQRKLGSCIDHTVQVVALTATLEPRHEDEILRMFDLPRAHAKIVRQVTTQKKHGYSVVRVDPCPDRDESLDHVVSLIKGKIAELERVHTRNPQFLVFCHTKREVEELAVALDAEPFYARIENGKETMARFLAGSVRILASTSAAASGLDGQGRIFVLFKGAPKTLQEVAQGGGRGARDGLPGAVVVFSGPHLDMRDPDEGVQEFLRADQCRRIAMDRFDDPRDRTGCEVGEVPCDHCHARDAERGGGVPGTPPPAAGMQPLDVGRPEPDDVLVRCSSPSSSTRPSLKSSPPRRPGGPESPLTITPYPSSSSSGRSARGSPRPPGDHVLASPAVPSKRSAPSPPPSSSRRRCPSSTGIHTASPSSTGIHTASPSSAGIHTASPSSTGINTGVSRLELAGSLPRASPDGLFFASARQDEEDNNVQTLRARAAQGRANRFRELERKLDVLVHFCIACGGVHSANRCSNPHPAGLHGAMPTVDLVRQKFNTRRYLAPFCACFKCLAPLASCASWTPREDGFAYARSPGPWQCRQGILEAFAIMSHHLQAEYGGYMRRGEWRVDTADDEAHVVHLGTACPEFRRGNEMMIMMMVQLEWMLDLLAQRHGSMEDWGSTVLPRGLIGLTPA
jgi:hypothetical protein